MLLKIATPLILALLLLPPGPGLADGGDSRLVHVVLVWLNDPGNAEHRARIIAETRKFLAIPGVEEIRVGEPVPGQRSVVDDSFDVGLYMVFSSKQALDSYLAHPDHKAARQSVLRPLTRKTVVYDFRDDGK